MKDFPAFWGVIVGVTTLYLVYKVQSIDSRLKKLEK